jgi:predicted nucleic acid-binding protein
LGRYFFDSSALVKRYHPETWSSEVARLFVEPGREIRISRLSFVEIQSVCAMKVRGGFLTVEEAEMQRERLMADIASGEIEVRSVTAAHFTTAEQLISRHSYTRRLRTLDALQLAVAFKDAMLSGIVGK